VLLLRRLVCSQEPQRQELQSLQLALQQVLQAPRRQV